MLDMPRIPYIAARLAVMIVVVSPLHAQRMPVTQSVDLVVPFAAVTFEQQDRVQLAYELHITNFLPTEVSLTTVQVELADGPVLAAYSDADLERRIVRPGLRNDHATPRLLGAGMRAVVNLWIALPADAPVPASVSHTVELDVHGKTASARTTVEGGTSAVSSPAVTTLDAPLRGGPWVAIYDPS
jgi:murein DD-endopeptidase